MPFGVTGVDPVSHGILDQGQQCRRRTANLQDRRVDVHRVLQAIRHAHLHQLEIRADEFQLALESRRRLVQQRHRRPKVLDQASKHCRRLRRARIDERLDVGERIEQEMRGDLRLQQMQTGVDGLPFQFAALERERERLMVDEGFLLTDDRRERRPGRDQHRGERHEHPVVVL
jgi:hypothetical protein